MAMFLRVEQGAVFGFEFRLSGFELGAKGIMWAISRL